jgi:hypothetical protein
LLSRREDFVAAFKNATTSYSSMMQQQKQQDTETEGIQEEQSITIDLSKLKGSLFTFDFLSTRTIDIAILCSSLFFIFGIVHFIYLGKHWDFSKILTTMGAIPTVIIPLLIVRKFIKELDPSFQNMQTRKFSREHIASHLTFFIDLAYQNTGKRNEMYLMPIFQEVLGQALRAEKLSISTEDTQKLKHLAQRHSLRRDYPEVMQGIITLLHKLHTNEVRLFLQTLAEEKPRDKKEEWISQAAQQCLDRWHDKFW